MLLDDSLFFWYGARVVQGGLVEASSLVSRPLLKEGQIPVASEAMPVLTSAMACICGSHHIYTHIMPPLMKRTVITLIKP